MTKENEKKPNLLFVWGVLGVLTLIVIGIAFGILKLLWAIIIWIASNFYWILPILFIIWLISKRKKSK